MKFTTAFATLAIASSAVMGQFSNSSIPIDPSTSVPSQNTTTVSSTTTPPTTSSTTTIPAPPPGFNSTTTETEIEVVTAYTTYCPYPTTFTQNGVTYTVTSATTLTITDCPCTITKPKPHAPPQPQPTTQPAPGPEPKPQPQPQPQPQPSTKPAPKPDTTTTVRQSVAPHPTTILSTQRSSLAAQPTSSQHVIVTQHVNGAANLAASSVMGLAALLALFM